MIQSTLYMDYLWLVLLMSMQFWKVDGALSKVLDTFYYV